MFVFFFLTYKLYIYIPLKKKVKKIKERYRNYVIPNDAIISRLRTIFLYTCHCDTYNMRIQTQ